MKELIGPILTQIVIPEIAAIIRAHFNATKTIPTTEQIMAALDLNVTRVVGLGEAFLQQTKPQPPIGG